MKTRQRLFVSCAAGAVLFAAAALAVSSSVFAQIQPRGAARAGVIQPNVLRTANTPLSYSLTLYAAEKISCPNAGVIPTTRDCSVDSTTSAAGTALEFLQRVITEHQCTAKDSPPTYTIEYGYHGSRKSGAREVDYWSVATVVDDLACQRNPLADAERVEAVSGIFPGNAFDECAEIDCNFMLRNSDTNEQIIARLPSLANEGEPADRKKEGRGR